MYYYIFIRDIFYNFRKNYYGVYFVRFVFNGRSSVFVYFCVYSAFGLC